MGTVCESVYSRLPAWCQNLTCSVYGWRLVQRRYGNGYEALEREVLQRQWWSEAQLREFAVRRLRAILEHACDTVPYYRRLFGRLDFRPCDVRDLTDIRRLPILTKRIVQENVADFTSEGLDGEPCSVTHTSGTTGAGLVFPLTLKAEQEQWAVWWRYRRRFGLNRDTWYAHFYGKSVVPLKQTRPPFWRVNLPGKQILFSAYHMCDGNMPAYIAALNRYRPAWIQGYPSLLTLVSSAILNAGRALEYQPAIVTTGAESLLQQQRALIEKAFRAPCRQHYGLAEGVANISECPEGNLHVDEDYGYVEFVPLEGDMYKIVATGYSNYAFPLIRYETGDIASLDASPRRCPCGRPGRLVKSIDGRKEDFVVTPTGRKIGRLDHIFKDMIHIRESQIFQDCPEHIVIRVVKGQGYTAGDEAMLLEQARKRLGSELRIEVQYLEEITRTAGRKLRFVISELKECKIDPSEGTPECTN